jgi:hypothetical protein
MDFSKDMRRVGVRATEKEAGRNEGQPRRRKKRLRRSWKVERVMYINEFCRRPVKVGLVPAGLWEWGQWVLCFGMASRRSGAELFARITPRHCYCYSCRASLLQLRSSVLSLSSRNCSYNISKV